MIILNIKSYFKKHPIIFIGIYAATYFTLFFLLESVVTVDKANLIHSRLDDYIPFCEYFVIPYVLWFFYIPLVISVFLIKDIDSFWKVARMMFLGNMLCLLIYAVFPSTVSVKGAVENKNIFCTLVNIIYAADTPTNVCPSIHVLDTLAAHIALCRSRLTVNRRYIKVISFVFLAAICISTVTLKQHSIIDVFASFLFIIPLERFAYRKAVRQKSPEKTLVKL